MEYTNVIVFLPNSTVEKLRKLSLQRGITMTAALKCAIELASYLSDSTMNGDRVLVGRDSVFTHIIAPFLGR